MNINELTFGQSATIMDIMLVPNNQILTKHNNKKNDNASYIAALSLPLIKGRHNIDTSEKLSSCKDRSLD